jgi:hypothetical protein
MKNLSTFLVLFFVGSVAAYQVIPARPIYHAAPANVSWQQQYNDYVKANKLNLTLAKVPGLESTSTTIPQSYVFSAEKIKEVSSLHSYAQSWICQACYSNAIKDVRYTLNLTQTKRVDVEPMATASKPTQPTISFILFGETPRYFDLPLSEYRTQMIDNQTLRVTLR